MRKRFEEWLAREYPGLNPNSSQAESMWGVWREGWHQCLAALANVEAQLRRAQRGER